MFLSDNQPLDLTLSLVLSISYGNVHIHMQMLQKKNIINFGIGVEILGRYKHNDFDVIRRICTTAVSGKHPEPNK
jgi:hypothetical protein